MDKKEILLLQEAERKRIAEELHDTTVQDMVCLSQQLELISLYIDQDLIGSLGLSYSPRMCSPDPAQHLHYL